MRILLPLKIDHSRGKIGVVQLSESAIILSISLTFFGINLSIYFCDCFSLDQRPEVVNHVQGQLHLDQLEGQNNHHL